MNAKTYTGKATVLDRNGMMLDVGKGHFEVTELGSWAGSLRVFVGSCLQTKSLTVLVEVETGERALAQVGPVAGDAQGDLIDVRVVGLEPPPF